MEIRRILAGSSVRYPRGIGLLGSLLVALSFTPGAAEAQTPYVMQIQPEPYTALPINGGTTTTLSPSSIDDGWADGQLPFPVTFFDQPQTELRVGTNGYATLGGGAANYIGNQRLPSSTSPHGVIPIWWADQYCPSGSLTTQTIGTAPARQYVVQWHCHEYSNSAGTWQAQLWFTEGSSTIKIKYGALSSSYSSWRTTAMAGIENLTGTVGYQVSCGNACTPTDWLTDQAVVFAQGPDVTVASVTGEAIAYSGVTSHMEAEVRNVGGEDALAFGLRFWVSADERLSSDDVEVGMATPATQDAVPGASAFFTLDAPIPLSLSPGQYYLLAEADPLNAVAEDTETNNVGFYGPFEIGLPAPDLIVESIAVPNNAEPGSNFTLDWTVRNQGNLIGVDVPYSLVISSNDVISSSDRRIFTGTITADALTSVPVSEQVFLPAEINAGTYYLGIVIDPDNEVYELGELNNEGVSQESFTVSSGDLVIATTVLPPAEIGSVYCNLLDATGGTGSYVWAVESGTLPAGLELQEERAGGDPAAAPIATLLCGRPAQVATSDFSLRVTSGELTVVQDYQLTVNETGMPLAIATAELPVAQFQVEYEATLLAVGGTAPYEWSVAAGELPPGLQLASSGALRGMPMVDGLYPVTFEVKDKDGTARSAELELRVSSPARLTCVTRSLPNHKVNEAYDVQLLAAGGAKPYTWVTAESRRLSNGVTDPGQTFVNAPPPGMILSGDGDVSGAPSAAGRYVWLVEVTDEENNAPDTCAITFEVTYDQGITVVTTALADAYVDTPYTVQLQAAGAAGFTSWSMAQGSTPPEGLELSEDGVISGVLAGFLLEGEKTRTFPFLVQVKDSENRINVAPLSVTLHLAPPAAETKPQEKAEEDDGGGCSAGVADPSLLALGAALGLAALRRRRS
ncbi:CARDB domain-containing protein [Vulgatibacter sp.]|uniref:CARDB domain-containing protein n=1 Tax=Vulgatibacter sp. TaxID=1971226 RepID=UPI00356ACA9B